MISYLIFRQTFVHILRSWHRLNMIFCDGYLVLSSLLPLIVYDLLLWCRLQFPSKKFFHNIKNECVRVWESEYEIGSSFVITNGSSNSSRSTFYISNNTFCIYTKPTRMATNILMQTATIWSVFPFLFCFFFHFFISFY